MVRTAGLSPQGCALPNCATFWNMLFERYNCFVVIDNEGGWKWVPVSDAEIAKDNCVSKNLGD